MSNPLLSVFTTPYQLPPFQDIQIEHFEEGIEKALLEARKEVEDIIDNKAAATFQNTIEALEQSGSLLQRNSSILFNLNAAETTDKLQQIAQQLSPKLAAFDSEVKQNEALFARVLAVYDQKETLNLSQEQEKLLVDTYLDFVRRGAQLTDDKKARFKEVSIELSKLSLTFSEHVLAETNANELFVEDEDQLSGLPDDLRGRAKELAKKKGKDGWIFTLQAPSYIPFMEYADNRELRKELYLAYMSKCFKGDENDNQDIILKIVKLKAELAQLLGYETFAHYILEQRMAESPQQVDAFLNELLEKSLPKAREEFEELDAFAKANGCEGDLQRWDWSYYSEKLRKEKYALDDELVKPYFLLEHVIQGVFDTAERLFSIRFRKNSSLPVYHEEVEAYEVLDKHGAVIATFYADFFPRDGKRGGAWMTSFRSQGKQDGSRVNPQVSIVCNFTPSTDHHPSLLKFTEVETLFHEFGHALHGMLADTTYQSLSGTHVYWDFVELPSQIMENWCYEKECLDLFARHYKTGELIPEDLIAKIKSAATYHEAYATVRQLSFATLDMNWHSLTAEELGQVSDVLVFEDASFRKTDLFPSVAGTCMSVQFSHIFAGGYAAGYYSYKWAEVLDADAFSLFQERGVFDARTAQDFKKYILSKGGTEHPMDLYVNFRGRKPSNEALLKRAGLSG